MELAIRERRISQGMSASELARRLETSVANVSRWEREPKRVNLVTLERIADVLGTTADQLISRGTSVAVDEDVGRKAAVIVTVKNLQEKKPDLPFDRSYLMTVTQRHHSELGAAIIEDDAMAPSLRPGDAVLVEPCEQVGSPGIYASFTDGAMRVRRLMPGLEEGTISVMTDNNDYPDFNDKPSSAFNVTGRVIWVGRKI